MADNSTIKTFTSADIEKYHKGQLSAKERHDLEKAALDDPFLADALEGYSITGINAAADIAELKKRLSERTGTTKVIPITQPGRSFFPWLRIAAMIVLVAGAGFLVYQFAFNEKKDNNIAQTESKDKEGSKSSVADTNNIGITTINKENTVIPPTGGKKKTETVVTTTGGNSSITETTETNSNALIKRDTVSIVSTDVATKPTTSAPAKIIDEKSNESVTKGSVDIKNKEIKAIADKYKKDMDGDGVSDVNALSRETTFAQKQNNRQQYRSNLFRGRVMDNNNNALPFANITNTRDNVGTYSDANGFFTLTSPDSVLDVQVRSLGYGNYNYRLRNDITSNPIILQDDNAKLSEVTVSNRKVNSTRSRNSIMTLEEPEPVDGWDNYDTYLANNLNMPETLKAKETKGGEVELSFEVDKNGQPVNITVNKSLCESCDKEAIRLVKEGPKFKRKAKKGRTTVTVAFGE